MIGTVINSVFTAKTYKKNRRFEFLQRRDRLSQQISDLNDRNTEFQLISARYELVAVKNAGLPLRGEQAERHTALIASIKVQREGVEEGMKLWHENIKRLHFIKAYIGYSSTLHILETSNGLIKTSLAETDEKIRQINLDFGRAIEKLLKKWQLSDTSEP